ncbi:hypothetical protein LIPSTDRAFT_105367 [Lipomyces starkeyi NRRL Y-11557]|uniref:Retrotransposon gag domain-containing protein n=1 Tax=Lipomyces starkeyi NRRL Y-11557 TaxID=675824 RepID=A0A1E3Q5H5_LIPST|nr:hypothetical protein LIPSTDRAFT_105367 [Lipomyces starkeyi NRRL Y-11557]
MAHDMLPFSTYAEFKNFVEGAFGDPDARLTAERGLSRLSQGSRPCMQYYAGFMRIMATLNWDDASNIVELKNRLCDEVKDLLIGHELTPVFNDFVKIYIQLDNSWLAREHERKAPRTYQNVRSFSHHLAPAPAPLPVLLDLPVQLDMLLWKSSSDACHPSAQDDVLVFSANFEEHIGHVKIVLGLLQKKWVVCKSRKR